MPENKPFFTLNELFKEYYADKMIDLIPEGTLHIKDLGYGWVIVEEHEIYNLPLDSEVTLSKKCDHKWKHYVGLIDSYDYCELCDEKKNT